MAECWLHPIECFRSIEVQANYFQIIQMYPYMQAESETIKKGGYGGF